ncbi:MAG: hypothetical protein C0501_15920 [Isosphaera sp.]|nr:hypothetical protein [Isosphaera sp.]
MKKLLWACAAVAAVGASAAAADIVYKPIDTKQLVVKPSQAAAGLAAQTISAVGQTAAGSIDNNGYVKTINNLLSKKIRIPSFQTGPSALPSPNVFPSTQYRSFNNPVMPIAQPARGR